MLESEFKQRLTEKLRVMFPGCIILKNDAVFMPGVPDMLILFQTRWASLEVKKSRTAKKQPNQEYYVDQMNSMSYSSFIFPENEQRVLDDLQHALWPDRVARVSQS